MRGIKEEKLEEAAHLQRWRYMAAAYAQNFLKTPEGGLLPDNRQKPK